MTRATRLPLANGAVNRHPYCRSVDHPAVSADGARTAVSTATAGEPPGPVSDAHDRARWRRTTL
jgi:hypothetical protein